MENSYFIFYESLFRAGAVSLSNSSEGFDSLLREGRLSLLLEQFTDEDANVLSAALKDQKEKTIAVAKALPKEMTETKQLLQNLAGEIEQVSNTREIAIMAQKGDAGAIKQKIEQLNSVFLRVGNATSAVVDTMLRAAENLSDVANEMTDEQRKTTLQELKTSLGNSKDPAEKKAYGEVAEVIKAVIDSFSIPDWHTAAVEKGSTAAKSASGGLWNAIKGFFKGIFGKVAGAIVDEGRAAFTKDMQGISVNDIIGSKGAMEAAKTALVGTVETAAQQTTSATGEAAAVANPDGAAAAGAESGGEGEAAAATRQVVATADNQTIGKSIKSYFDSVESGAPDKNAAKKLIAQLQSDYGAAKQLMTDELVDAIRNLPGEEKEQIFGSDEKGTASQEALKAILDKNLALEAHRRREQLLREGRQRRQSEVLIESDRWAQLAGIRGNKL